MVERSPDNLINVDFAAGSVARAVVPTEKASGDLAQTFYKITPFGMRRIDDDDDEGGDGGLDMAALRALQADITQETASRSKTSVGWRIPDPYDPNTQGEEHGNGIKSHPLLENANGMSAFERNSNVADANPDAQQKSETSPNHTPTPSPSLSNSAGLSSAPTLSAL